MIALVVIRRPAYSRREAEERWAIHDEDDDECEFPSMGAWDELEAGESGVDLGYALGLFRHDTRRCNSIITSFQRSSEIVDTSNAANRRSEARSTKAARALVSGRLVLAIVDSRRDSRYRSSDH